MENKKETSTKPIDLSQEVELKRLSDFVSLLVQIDKRINGNKYFEKQND